VAYREGFLNRPIVNEYIELFWKLLVELGYKEKREEKKFSMLLTHDVDEIQRYPNLKKVIMGMGGDVLYRKSLSLPFKTLYDYILVSMKQRKDPYDSFDEIMDISDSLNIKSHFFFMSGGTTERYDNRYHIENPLVKKIIEKIKKRGHFIGLHPSYNAYNNAKQFKIEKEALEKVNEAPITTGREHYLRFEVPTTWQLWEDNNFEWCSNLAYAKSAGFRTGSCYPYTPFNILSQKRLNVKERPLIMMEVTFAEASENIKKFDTMANYYLNIIKKYNGEFVLLWHNASFKEASIAPYSLSYTKTLKRFKELEKLH
jgi:peptidoglycan/xylan/chitin deacetylase (PgdA/CDA1 family)